MNNAFESLFAGVIERISVIAGKQITIRHTIPGAYTPQTGITGAATVTDTVVATVGPPAPYAQSQIDGTLIQSGDMRVVVPASALSNAPAPTSHSVIMDQGTWSIVHVAHHYGLAEKLLYVLQLRR